MRKDKDWDDLKKRIFKVMKEEPQLNTPRLCERFGISAKKMRGLKTEFLQA